MNKSITQQKTLIVIYNNPVNPINGITQQSPQEVALYAVRGWFATRTRRIMHRPIERLEILKNNKSSHEINDQKYRNKDQK